MAYLVTVSDDTVIREATAYEEWISLTARLADGEERTVLVLNGIECYVKED